MRKTWPFVLTFLVLAGVSLPFVLAGPGFVPVLARYSGGAVTGGGSIQGTVTVDPVPESVPLAVGKDEKVCASAQKSPRLVVDPATKGVANVVVYLDGIEKGKPLPTGVTATIDQKGCRYDPHISIVPVKSSLGFSSSDPILHNVHVYKGTPDDPHALTKDVLNGAMKDAAVPRLPLSKRVMRKPGFYYVRCDAGHIWMSAYVWVVEHPYYVVTDAQGKFELEDVPAGTYKLRFWHENWKATPKTGADGKVTSYVYGAPKKHAAEVTVKAGEAATVDWTIAGK